MKKILTAAISIFSFFSYAQNNNNVVLEPAEFAKKMGNPNTIILDVRTPEEYNNSHIENSTIINYRAPEFKEEIRQLDPEKTYLIYCRSGVRSAAALDSLKALGFTHLYDLKGGINAWNKENMPTIDGIKDKISNEEYQQLITSEKVVLVDFYAPWCGPCIKMSPMFEKISQDYKGKIVLIKINADENKNLVKPFIEKGFPILYGYKNGKTQWERAGLLEEKELRSLIDNLIK